MTAALMGASLLAPSPALAAIGQVQLSRGGAVAQQAESAPRLLARGEEIRLGDVLTTEADSFVVIRFTDAAKLTLRPLSRLTLEVFDAKDALFYLERGGLQAETGSGGSLRLRTPQGLLRTQGARFNARLCEDDCPPLGAAATPDPAGRVPPPGQQIAARVVELRGEAHAEAQGQRHPLLDGSAVYSGDTVVTGAAGHLGMAFRDGGRISLIQNTRFDIQRFDYQGTAEAGPPGGEASYRLVTGGLRAVTGFIGKGGKGDYEVETPVTTIGVRGTGFDAVCIGTCLAPQGATRSEGGYQDGLYTHVWEAAIVQRMPIGTFDLASGQTAYLPNPRTPPIPLDTLPEFLRNPGAPRPDGLPSAAPGLSAEPTPESPAPGLYVFLEAGSGQISLGSTRLGLGVGQGAYAGPDGLSRLSTPADFQLHDPYPPPWQPEEAMSREHSLLNDDPTLSDEFACKVQ